MKNPASSAKKPGLSKVKTSRINTLTALAFLRKAVLKPTRQVS
ncbi:hypothetical protein Pmgp_03604 [Pelotomaculum propionicicum]|uniref:Uncharacterized protein n=1 Tax=Pelotomaculum propionicicum TaxID=258475 RepID=A0A4Y7RIL9_9FIRM|nr:hypothetical protein Pmgp_03604 [Pelotomaculum propionicicum]